MTFKLHAAAHFAPCAKCGRHGDLVTADGTRHPVAAKPGALAKIDELVESGRLSTEEYQHLREVISESDLRSEAPPALFRVLAAVNVDDGGEKLASVIKGLTSDEIREIAQVARHVRRQTEAVLAKIEELCGHDIVEEEDEERATDVFWLPPANDILH